MTCAPIEHLAAAAADETGDDVALAVEHARSCERCAALLAEQRELRALARRAPSPVLASATRVELAARIELAANDTGPCAALEDLAAAASIEESAEVGSEPSANVLAAFGHARGCERCAALFGDQREVRSLARRLPWPSLDDDRRAELAAEVMARAETLPRKRRTRIVIAGLAIAAAAGIALVLGLRAGEREQVARIVDDSASVGSSGRNDPPRVVPHVEPIEVPDVAPVPQLAMVTPGSGAQLSRETTAGGDVVRLRDGGVTIDAERSSAVVVAGDTRVDVSRARASITAQRGAVRAVQVFAGSVEVTSGGKRLTVSAGTVWRAELGGTTAKTPTPPSAPPTTRPPTPTVAETSMHAFRDGWALLRAGKHRDAIAAFDRATDAVVAEDAVFWAAVAAERAGDGADASRRYAEFIARFPSSPRIDSARAATRRLAP